MKKKSRRVKAVAMMESAEQEDMVEFTIGGPTEMCDCSHERQDHVRKGRGRCRGCECPSFRGC